MGWIILGLLGIALLIWLGLSIKIVGPDEMAVKVIFGKPIAFCKSGWVIDLRFPFSRRLECFIKKYPQKMFNFDYPKRSFITKAGTYEGKDYGAQAVKVSSVVYLNFPRDQRGKEATDDDLPEDVEMETSKEKVMTISGEKKETLVEKTHPLIKVLRAQVPIKEETEGKEKGLKDWTEEAVIGAIRVAFGGMTWAEAVEKMEKIKEEAGKVFTRADGALIRVGFSKKGVQLVVTEIEPPEDLTKAMLNVDKQRLEAEAAPFEAEQRAEETLGAIIEGVANMKGMTRKEVQDALKADPVKFIEDNKPIWDSAVDTIHRRMGIDGKAYLDIRVQGAGGIEQMLLNLAAAWKNMPGGKGSGTGEEKPEKKEGKKEKGKAQGDPLKRIAEVQKGMREGLPIQKDKNQEEEE